MMKYFCRKSKMSDLQMRKFSWSDNKLTENQAKNPLSRVIFDQTLHLSLIVTRNSNCLEKYDFSQLVDIKKTWRLENDFLVSEKSVLKKSDKEFSSA